MIKESLSSRSISDYLKNEYDEGISHTDINNFVKKLNLKLLLSIIRKRSRRESGKKENTNPCGIL